MFLVTAYAPPSFLKPCIVWRTCKCKYGIHTSGCFVDALNGDHAITLAHSERYKWFLMVEHPSWRAAVRYHTKLSRWMQNGVGTAKWEAGYEPYLALLAQFEHAPEWQPDAQNGAENGS